MKIRLGLSAKIIFIVTLIVVAAVGGVVYNATKLFADNAIGLTQQLNLTAAEGIARQVNTIVQELLDKASVMTQTVSQAKGEALSADAEQTVQNVLRTNDELISFGIYRPDGKGGFKEHYFATKEEILAEFDMKLSELRKKPMDDIAVEVARRPDQVLLFNTSQFFKKPILTVAFLTRPNQHKERWLVRCDIRQDGLVRQFASAKSAYVSAVYMLDPDGKLLVHSNPQYALGNYDYSGYQIVGEFKKGLSNKQLSFTDGHGHRYLGAFRTVGVGGAAVFAQVEEKAALRGIGKMQYQSLLLTAVVIGLAFILNFLFSKSMTSPLTALYRATERIAQGQFDVAIESKSHDEIGALAQSFQKMVVGLKERDKLKTTFNKFHSKEIAQKILSGAVKLGGERKMATVFFSDIRNFTSMSEEMNPDEVVHMLNEYMTEMVKVINKHKGVVDKYIGDAIMALWGVPNAHPDDPYQAVLAALEMRTALKALNKKRRSRGQPELRIGMGIHTGEVLAGNIGSEEHLEYTVIGDTVNQASRIESSNKQLSSDLLISESTYTLLKRKPIVVGPAIPIRVKGKSEPIVVYQVIGRKDADGQVISELSLEERENIMNLVPEPAPEGELEPTVALHTSVRKHRPAVRRELEQEHESESEHGLEREQDLEHDHVMEQEFAPDHDSAISEPAGEEPMHPVAVVEQEAEFGLNETQEPEHATPPPRGTFAAGKAPRSQAPAEDYESPFDGPNSPFAQHRPSQVFSAGPQTTLPEEESVHFEGTMVRPGMAKHQRKQVDPLPQKARLEKSDRPERTAKPEEPELKVPRPGPAPGTFDLGEPVTFGESTDTLEDGEQFGPEDDDSKTVALAPSPAQNPPVPPPKPARASATEEKWYLVRDPGAQESEGPYTHSELKLIASQPGFGFDQAYVFKEGDAEMTPLAEIKGISRRSERTNTKIQVPLPEEELRNEADSDEWYIYGDESRTYGPYAVEQIREALDSGHISRTTYCWHQGLPNWIYVYQIPGFDRRDENRTHTGSIPLSKIKRTA